MSLRDEIKPLSGARRKFFLLRVADVDTSLALNLCNIKHGTYNTWLQNQAFVELYRRRDEFTGDYKQEAVQLLRRDNQLEAVLLEGKILLKMKEELDSGEYNLIRSQIAREVYSKLITDLDATPQTQMLTWQQRIGQIINNPPAQISQGEVIDAQFETINSQEAESPESTTPSESQESLDEVQQEG